MPQGLLQNFAFAIGPDVGYGISLFCRSILMPLQENTYVSSCSRHYEFAERRRETQDVSAGRTHGSAPTEEPLGCAYLSGMFRRVVWVSSETIMGCIGNGLAHFAPQAAGLTKMFRDRTISPDPVGADLCVRPWWALQDC